MGAPGLDFRGVAAAVEGSRCKAQVLYACDTVEGVPVWRRALLTQCTVAASGTSG